MHKSHATDQLCINTIRALSIDAVQKANSGHPGLPLGAASMAFVLWDRFLNHNPTDPQWPNRDRFVLSAGHGSMLLYSLLHLTGYDLTLDDIKAFRQPDSKTPGHPEFGMTPGVQTTTGPLGQGFANGVGMAISEAHLAARYNRPDYEIINQFTYGIVGDGDLMEGVAAEAASLAGHLQLGKLIYLYDDNSITIDGSTDITFSENTSARFESYGWQVLHVTDGNDKDALFTAIQTAQQDKNRPSLICVNTIIGFGSPNRQGKSKAHGEPLGEAEVKATKKALGWNYDEPFHVPEEVYAYMKDAVQRGKKLQSEWHNMFAAYAKEYPELALDYSRILNRELPVDWQSSAPVFKANEQLATRAASGETINALAGTLTELIGGSADLAGSNLTTIIGDEPLSPENYAGRNIYFGVREHAMSSICNGISLHANLRPYNATFLVFSDYMRPAIRLSALMEQPVIYIFTHDSIGLGEDGPTHQPIEHFAALRAIPNLTFIRPADANETVEAWKVAIMNSTGPVAMALSRQKLPVLDRTVFGKAEGLQKGAYILQDAPDKKPALLLMASGSEVSLILKVAEILQNQNIPTRVISMPSWELFEKQSADYKNSVLPATIKARVAVEAGVAQGWEKYIGDQGITITIDNQFGASAPIDDLMQTYGFDADKIARQAAQLVR